MIWLAQLIFLPPGSDVRWTAFLGASATARASSGFPLSPTQCTWPSWTVIQNTVSLLEGTFACYVTAVSSLAKILCKFLVEPALLSQRVQSWNGMRKKGNTSSVNHLGMTRQGEFCAENGKLSTKPGCLSSFLLIEDFQELCLIERGWLYPVQTALWGTEGWRQVPSIPYLEF